ncbi:predicted protein [Sclerotinia sclerotiorum 1980 UF-70]|uniref:Uncharacterized protein n=1 Tax=Sclerotinia sclerotiorum (strain ATCC 18683 / 1980 / Ss-1) TaxID=665079 RepID=A7EJQ6_SCLS1|nr:predicted protein [Sclerotinia sclerotiorum 1980 UF-70]EDO03072.1 predicted protein [Sclerotinia sclerotiorum 1980 UF-70]
MFWCGTLTLTIDLTPTPLQTLTKMKILASILPSYTPYTHIIKLAIRTSAYRCLSTIEYKQHVSDFQLLISQINKFEKVQELHMTLVIGKWAHYFSQLRFCAGLYGLRRMKWSLAYRVEGVEEVGLQEIEPECCFMRWLVRVYWREIVGNGGLERIVE